MRSLPALVLLLASGPLAAQPEGATLHLGVGQQRVIQPGNVARVAIGDPEIADVKQVGGGGELLITGVGEGRTSLLVWRTGAPRLSYAVLVRRQDPREVVSEIRALLGELEGIQVHVVGDRVVLEGETVTTGDSERVQQVAQLYPAVTSFVRTGSGARRLAADALNRALQKHGLRSVSASVLGNALLVEGSVEAQEELRRLDLILRACGEKTENLVTVAASRNVLVEVEFVEVASGSTKAVGIKPPTSFASSGEGITASLDVVQPLRALDSGQTQKSGALTLNASVATDFSAAARFDRGAVRILSRPRLICRSGAKAEFMAGGEVPVVLATQNQFAVELKKFGIQLEVTPTADRSGNIATDIHAEVSDVDRSISVRTNGLEVPGLRVRNVRTSVTVRDGETIILSGLYNSDEEKEVSKIPLLGHIPILGELFKSRAFVERRTELAIYVTPRLIAPQDDAARELIDDARKLYQDAADSVSFSIFD